MGVLGPAHDRRGRSVGDAGTVEHAELAGDAGHRQQLIDRHRSTELGPLVAGAVGVVLRRDAGHHLLDLADLEPLFSAYAGTTIENIDAAVSVRAVPSVGDR